MTVIDRNPDVMIGEEPMPAGMQVIEGKHLMIVPRGLKIPFGVARERVIQPNGSMRIATLGLIIRDEHAQQVLAGIDAQNSRKKYTSTTTK